MALSSFAILQLLEEQQGSFLQLSILSILVLFFSIFFLIKLHGAWSPKKSNNPPPSPPKIPFIGNLHQLGTLAHRSFGDMSKKYGPLMLLHLGQAPTLIVSSAEMATEIMKNQDLVFANRPFTTAAKAFLYRCIDIGFAPYGEYWRQVRKICVLELLSIKRVQSFRYVRDEEVAVLVDKISRSCSRGDVINLSELLLTISNNIVSRCALGAKYEGAHENRFGELSREIMKLMGAFSFADYFPSLGWMDVVTGLTGKLKRTSKELDNFLDQVIDEHILRSKSKNHNQQEDKEDLINTLLLAQKDNTNLARDNIKAIILDMFVGGSDTTATNLEWAMAELIKNPKLLKKAQDEVRRVVGNKSKVEQEDINQMEYLKCIIKETLRLHAPIPTLVPRESSKSTKIKGYDVPQNTRVYINVWAIQRDSELWENAEEFRPERFENNPIDFRGLEFQFLPFGSGRRGCPGISFGLAVVELVLANLLYRFDWELPSGEKRDELDMTEAFGLTVNKKIPLHVVPTLQSAS